MSLPSPAAKPAITAAAVSAEWIAIVREIAQRDGHALRGGVLIASAVEGGEKIDRVTGHTIEAQSINHPDVWPAIQLPGDGHTFTTSADRDAVLRQIQEGK
jgi:hypothetical protein